MSIPIMKSYPDGGFPKHSSTSIFSYAEMAIKLELPQRTVERRIQRAGIKPISREAIYPLGTLDIISDVKIGRPKKTAEPEPAKPAKKAKK